MQDRFKFRFWNTLRNEYENTYSLESCIFLDYVIPEQCTGLKDKNGRLIYENDLIKIDDDVAVINWSDYYARFMLESSEDIFDFERSYAEECEVIGNIHENANLLELKQDD